METSTGGIPAQAASPHSHWGTARAASALSQQYTYIHNRTEPEPPANEPRTANGWQTARAIAATNALRFAQSASPQPSASPAPRAANGWQTARAATIALRFAQAASPQPSASPPPRQQPEPIAESPAARGWGQLPVPTTEPAAFAPSTDDARAGMNPQLEPLEVFRCARPRGSRVWA